MLVTFLRSSSINSFELCQMQYFLGAVLGIRSPSGRKADLGNSVHKALEVLSRQKLARQRGESSFVEPEANKTFVTGEVDAEAAITHGWSVYEKPGYTRADRQDVYDLTMKVLTRDDGAYHPENLDIVAPEQFFDLPVEAEWAWYDYANPRGGPRIQGQLRIRGTVDLLYRDDNGIIIYHDYKTGRQWDWAAQKRKDWASLMVDRQLLLYYHAVRRLYPDDDLLFSIDYVREDGVFFLPYGDEQDAAAVAMLREMFEKIRDCEMPDRRMDEVGPRGQPCSFCHYARAKAPTGESLCDYYHGQLVQLGMSKCVAKHANGEPWLQYGGGGGQSDRSAKPTVD